jgi:hypothetical protein
MAQYGYMVYTFRVHRHGKGEHLSLGRLPGGQDALVCLYGLLRGLEKESYKQKKNYLRILQVDPRGRVIQFKLQVGQSGYTSKIIDPIDGDTVVFDRSDHHVEAGERRGVIIAPFHSRVGLLILEVRGRSSAKTILAPALKKGFRCHTQLILNIEAVVDEEALKEYIAKANVKAITLRKTGLPGDIAEAVSMREADAQRGKLELRITPGRIRQFQRDIVSRLRGDGGVRRRLLEVGGLEFDELSIGMEVGTRKTTLTVTAERIPSFVYDLGSELPSDDAFFDEVRAGSEEIGEAVGMTVSAGWDAGSWTDESLSVVLALPAEVAHSDEGDFAG